VQNPIKKTTQLQGITDLTVLARVKTGFVPGAFNAVTYVDRLTRVLRVLNAIRQSSREAALQQSPFADSVGRFRAIHFFRFAVVPSVDAPGQHQLLLNVTFDGGWEPYMRIIWGPLGKLLDLLFCHCEGYPMAFQCSFETYMRWVRGHEVPSSFFYADSAFTVADAHYLRQLEEMQCDKGGLDGADLRAAGLALSDPPPNTIPSDYAVNASVRVLKALESLREHFPKALDTQTEPSFWQNLVLLRFAYDLLRDLREWISQGEFDPGGRFDRMAEAFKNERKWLTSLQEDPPAGSVGPGIDRTAVQAGIADAYASPVRHGVLALLRIKNVDRAREWLIRDAKITAANETDPEGGIYRSLALTLSGLRRLGVPQEHLALLPHAFNEGMEARAGVLGDLRSNHPDNWRRPKRNWPWPKPSESQAGPPIELSTVHLLLQLRTAVDPKDYEKYADGTTLVPSLATALNDLDDGMMHTGLEVLFVQPMRLGPQREKDAAGRDHFGFVDGISQPSMSPTAPPPSYWSDQVKTGDLFLGHPNSRGDQPEPHQDPAAKRLLHYGSFLVVRKLRQFPDRLEALLAESARRSLPDAGPDAQAALREDLKAKLMGRKTDGTALINAPGMGNNDFDFRGDADGSQCPHRSHIRRANPRGPFPLPPSPRIARRGMSYGPPVTGPDDDAERGVVFMAYNASIAEQFEVIQRWLTSGNSSGLSSAQDDPLLGVPEIGKRRTYRYVHEGKVVRVDLGEKPLAQLEWGLYAFVPSLEALKHMAEGFEAGGDSPSASTPAPVARAGEPDQETQSKEKWRLRLEDENVRADTWKEVRDAHVGVQNAEGYGLLAGSSQKVLEVLKDNGENFSVNGYGDRMHNSIGRGFLGMDDVGEFRGHAEQAPGVNRIIEEFIDEKGAFDAAFGHAGKYLETLLTVSEAATGRREALVDLVEFGRRVLTLLCKEWFGLPDEVLMKSGTKVDDWDTQIARCPGHLLTVSRYVFSPHPMPPVEAAATIHGPLVLNAVKKLLQEATEEHGKLTDLVDKIVKDPAMKAEPDLAARTVAGVMLGFPPTVLGNLVTVLVRWVGTLQLWDLQQDMPPVLPPTYDEAAEVLREALLDTMREAPVPYVIWRTAMKDHALGDEDCKKGDRVIVGLGSAVSKNVPKEAQPGDHKLMFGGAREGDLKTTHACPGYALAMGVMMGCVAALLIAGALGRTPDPRVLRLTGDSKKV
jgi:hypothetical protein